MNRLSEPPSHLRHRRLPRRHHLLPLPKSLRRHHPQPREQPARHPRPDPHQFRRLRLEEMTQQTHQQRNPDPQVRHAQPPDQPLQLDRRPSRVQIHERPLDVPQRHRRQDGQDGGRDHDHQLENDQDGAPGPADAGALVGDDVVREEGVHDRDRGGRPEGGVDASGDPLDGLRRPLLGRAEEPDKAEDAPPQREGDLAEEEDEGGRHAGQAVRGLRQLGLACNEEKTGA